MVPPAPQTIRCPKAGSQVAPTNISTPPSIIGWITTCSTSSRAVSAWNARTIAASSARRVRTACDSVLWSSLDPVPFSTTGYPSRAAAARAESMLSTIFGRDRRDAGAASSAGNASGGSQPPPPALKASTRRLTSTASMSSNTGAGSTGAARQLA